MPQRQIQALFLFVGLLLAGRAQAGPWSVTFSPVTAETKRTAGGILVVGEGFSLTLDPGVGIFSADRTALMLTADEDALVWDPAPAFDPDPAVGFKLEAPTTLRGPGWDGLLQSGTVRRNGQQLQYVGRAPPPPRAGVGWIPAIGLAMVILLLYRRTGAMRRRLDQPRVPLRRRSSVSD